MINRYIKINNLFLVNLLLGLSVGEFITNTNDFKKIYNIPEFRPFSEFHSLFRIIENNSNICHVQSCLSQAFFYFLFSDVSQSIRKDGMLLLGTGKSNQILPLTIIWWHKRFELFLGHINNIIIFLFYYKST